MDTGRPALPCQVDFRPLVARVGKRGPACRTPRTARLDPPVTPTMLASGTPKCVTKPEARQGVSGFTTWV